MPGGLVDRFETTSLQQAGGARGPQQAGGLAKVGEGMRVEPEIEADGAAEPGAEATGAAAGVQSKDNTVDPPLMEQWCLRRGCIQEKKSELGTSIYRTPPNSQGVECVYTRGLEWLGPRP